MKQLKFILHMVLMITGVFLGSYGVLEVKNWMGFPVFFCGVLVFTCGFISITGGRG